MPRSQPAPVASPPHEPEATGGNRLVADASREHNRESRVSQQSRQKDDHRAPDVRFGTQPGVMNEAVADECKRECRATENDCAQAGAARFRRPKTYTTSGPCAAETEPPA